MIRASVPYTSGWGSFVLLKMDSVRLARGGSLSMLHRAKYELLDSGECGSVGTPAFNAECSELAHLMARMSELCKHLNLPMPKELHRPPHFNH